MLTGYRTIARSGEHEIEIRRSRFRCLLRRVDDEDAARAVIAARRKEHWNATHNCTAYVLGAASDKQKSSDDGEPAGTAGVPMLEVLRRRELSDVVAVVTRWFGGVQLGAGGLIRAYGQAVAETADLLGVVELRPARLVNVAVDFPRAGRIEHELRASGYAVRDTAYTDRARFDVAVDAPAVADFQEWITSITGGEAQLTVGEVDYVEVPR
ncbi:YigZ family protein [Actinoalloteichus hymeniacidonis]|uniref:YigZ family protein n=1 Tax=Actinoalloteichus hymeniacidonis TaxID=340345 RepID=A0AAC9MYR6_9PSEU|nr:YigZ family protein [Actinoalloteichus hymeniacidonis]AOS63585.1 hypothetical protein TL08_13855 [Actinoalloteichus hymeniacidonis]MBB5908369.1 putative YigZ family protein [Actinoalloteichus hymeniacidonis]